MPSPVDKQKNEINILKPKDFIMLWNVLFVKGCLNGNAPGSFNNKFHSSKLRLTHTRSSSAYQLKVIYFGLTIYCYEICSHTFIHSFIHSIVLIVMAIVVHFITLFYLCSFRILFFWISCSLNHVLFNKMSKNNIKIK